MDVTNKSKKALLDDYVTIAILSRFTKWRK